MAMVVVPLRTVGEILGHKTAAMTERHAHLTVKGGVFTTKRGIKDRKWRNRLSTNEVFRGHLLEGMTCSSET